MARAPRTHTPAAPLFVSQPPTSPHNTPSPTGYFGSCAAAAQCKRPPLKGSNASWQHVEMPPQGSPTLALPESTVMSLSNPLKDASRQPATLAV